MKTITKKDIDNYIKYWNKIDELNMKGIERKINEIVKIIYGKTPEYGITIQNGDVCFSIYYSGCGDEEYSFPTKLLYYTNEEVKIYIEEKQRKKILAEKRKLAYEKRKEEKKKEEYDKKEYIRLKEKYEK